MIVVGYSLFSTDKTRVYIKGPTVRSDWLEQLGTEAPETLDEYHDLLIQFRDTLEVKYPMWLHYSGINYENQLTRAFGIDGTKLIVKDGVVTSSLLESGMKDYLMTMNQWYSEGLFDSDFYSENSEEPTAQSYAQFEYGVFYAYASDFTEIEVQSEDPNCNLIAFKDAVMNKDDELLVSNGVSYEADSNGAYNITTNCKNVELAMKWVDFFYSPDGWLLCNYGTEGVTFEYDESGTPHWTELLTKSELPGFVVESKYIMLMGAFYMEGKRQLDDYTDVMLGACDVWESVEADSGFINYPSYITLDMDVREEAANINSDMTTYVEESMVKFITGELNFEGDYDNFINTLSTLKIERYIDIYQDAYNFYN